MPKLIIQNLHAGIKNKKILQGINLDVPTGKITALMGPNGSGKSTLAQVLMGHPDYQVKKGKVIWRGKNILKLKPHQRAKLGLFLAFQYPYEIPGVNFYEFLLTAYQSIGGKKASQADFNKRLQKALADLKLSEKFLERGLNEGFSGGEKKKAEILQLKIFQPKIAVLDETDSGLDIDALKLIAKNVRQLISSKIGILVITHYQRLLTYLKPDIIHVLINGQIKASGGPALAKKLEKHGYAKMTNF